jgi:Electron transfer DM13
MTKFTAGLPNGASRDCCKNLTASIDTMWDRTLSLFSKHRVITAIIGLTVLTGVWYLFRPELLFINRSVNEAPPFDTTAQPLNTGLFTNDVHETSGRATIYRQSSGGLILRLSEFRTSNGPDVHVVLAKPNDILVQNMAPGSGPAFVELGALKGNQGDQDYLLPANVDVNRYSVVSIYCERFHAVFGTAILEPF